MFRAAAGLLGVRQMFVQPSARISPIAADLRQTDFQDRGCFLVRIAAEEFFLDDFRRRGIHFGQSLERVVERHQFGTPFHRHRDLRSVVNVHDGALAFGRAMGAGPIYQNAAHLPGRDVQEVFAVTGLQRLAAKETQERFVNQQGRLKRRAGSFRAHDSPSQIVEVAISNFNELIACGLVAAGGSG